MEDLDFNLIVFSPYRDLAIFLVDAGVDATCGQRAWGALNDSYRGDANLLYPPHIVAIGCLCLAASTSAVDLSPWLQRLNIDLNQVRLAGRRVILQHSVIHSYHEPDMAHGAGRRSISPTMQQVRHQE